MVCGSDCESPSTLPLSVITVTRAPLAAICETGPLVIAPQGALGIEIDRQQDRDQQREKGKAEFPEKIKPHGFQTNSLRRARFSNAWGFPDRIRFFLASGERTRPRCAA